MRGKSVSISAVSTDDYINDAEDENALTISGTSNGLASGTTITVGVDGSGTDISGKTGTTNASGAWSVSLTSAEVKALDASTPAAIGETLTITAAATGATSGTRQVIYDPVAPTTTVHPISGGYIDASEDDGSTDVVATRNELLKSMSFSVSDGTDTLTAKTGTATDVITGAVYAEKLTSSMSALSLANDDEFGRSVAIDDDILAVGAWEDNTGGTGRGTVYLIKDSDNDGDWMDATSSDILEINENTAGISLNNDAAFGTSVALGGGVLAVGAAYSDIGGNNRGAVYLIDDGDDDWATIESTDVKKIDSNTAGLPLSNGDIFGYSVALKSGLLAVGSIGHDGGFTDTGAVYLIKDGGDGWGSILTTDVTTIDEDTNGIPFLSTLDYFGSSVAFGTSGSTSLLAIGVMNAETVYLIKEGGDSWASVASADVTKIDTNTDGISVSDTDRFGSAVAFGGGVLAIGESRGGIIDRGVVYLIENGGDAWGSIVAADVTKLGDSTPGLSISAQSQFGSAVAFDDDTLAVGARRDDTGGSDRGAVYNLDALLDLKATLTTDDFEKDSAPTAGDSKLADGATVTVTATATDNAGNAGTGTASFIYDQSPPTISSVATGGTTLIVTMDEDVYATTTPDTTDFAITGGGAPSVSGISGLPTTAAGADSSFTLTIASALTAGSPTLAYTQNSADAKTIKDKAGNKLATVTGKTISSITNAPSAPTVALQSPASSPSNDSTPTIRVTVDTNQQNGTVQLFSNSSCSTSISSSVTVDAATEDVDTTALTEGVHTIYAKHANIANLSTCSTTGVSYTYDGTAPTITTGTLDLAAADDTGVNTDNITKNTTDLTISGTLSAAGASGDYVQLYSNGTKIAGATDTTLSNTAWTADADLSEGTHAITAKVLDAAGNEGTASTALTIVVDTTVPVATYTTATTGGTTSGSTTYLNTGDTVSVVLTFPESIASTAPIVQFKNNTTNLGSAVTSVQDETLLVALSDSTGDSAGATDALDFGTPSSVLTRETVASGGYVYKVNATQSSLYIGVSGDAATAVGLKGKWSTTKPTSSQISDSTFGTEFVSVNSRGANATFYAGKRFENIAAGTYLWFYPAATRAVTNREMTVITNISSGKVMDFSNTSTDSDTVSATDPIDFGTVSATGVTRESLGPGYVYKTTKAFRRLFIGTDATLPYTGTYAARRATSKPTTTNLSTHGTQLWSRSFTSNVAVSGGIVLKDVPAGTYFWVYPSISAGAADRTLELRGTDVIISNQTFTATKTIAASDTAASGNLKYDITNEASVTDIAGNTLAAKEATTIANTAIDTTVPTISTAAYGGTTVILTMSEDVAVSGTKTGSDFTVTGGGAPTVSSYTISGSTVTLTLSAAIASGSTVTLAYAKNGTAANRITDIAGNELAAVTAQSVDEASVSVSAVSTDDYINDAEDENALIISGTSSGLASGTTVTVGVDGSGTDITGKTGTTNASGAWSVSLTSAEVKALDASTPDADGEDLTITATATGASSGTRTVSYDPTAPDISSVAVTGTTLTVTMDESVYAATTPDNGDFVITGGGAPSVSGISGLPTTVAGADNSFTLTIASALTGGSPTLAYTRNSTDAKIIKDKAGNKLADLTGQAIVAPPAAPTLALQSPASSPSNDSTPTIRVTVDTNQQNGTVELFSDSGRAQPLISSSVTVDAATEDVTTTTLTEANSPYTIYAKHTSTSNVSICSTTSVSYTYDATAPTITTGTLDLASGDDTGTNTDNITKKTTDDLTISGTLSAAGASGDYVQLYDNGTKIAGATDTTLSNTAWSIDLDLSEGTHPITAKVLDAAGNEGTASTALTIVVDTTAPAATYTTATTGGTTSGSTTYLNENDTVSVRIVFPESIASTAPTVQYKNNTSNLGSAITSARDGTLAAALSNSAGDSAGTADALDFGTPSSVLTREAVSNGGFVYKVTAAQSSLYIGVSGDATTGVGLKGKWHTTKPTSSQISNSHLVRSLSPSVVVARMRRSMQVSVLRM